MSYKQCFILAIKSLSTAKVRSFLTMLGIIIGVCAVIVIVSMGQGMTNSMQEAFESMGSNLVSVIFKAGGPRVPYP